MRYVIATAMNLLVPGTGMIVLGRTWLGVALSMWFGLSAEATICGGWIAPASIPVGVTIVTGLFAAGAWVAAQCLLLGRIRFLRDPNLPEELAVLRQMAEQSLAEGDPDSARTALIVALSVDDSDIASRVLWARMLTLTGKRRRARRAWRRAARLDRSHRFTQEIEEALRRLQAA